jgi:uncharacterized protein
MKTPGVYVLEKNAFPNSVVEVATAVPAFVGYTERAKDGNKSLLNRPWRITSLAEYEQYYGGPPLPKFTIREAKDDDDDSDEFVVPASVLEIGDQRMEVARQDKFNMYYQMRFFFANGGGACYIVSVNDNKYADELDKDTLIKGVTSLEKEDEPTIVLVPECVYLPADACYDIQVEMLKHCGNVMRNRVAVFDIHGGYKNNREALDAAGEFQERIGTEFLSYGAAYFPWLHTSIVSENEVNFRMIAEAAEITDLMTAEADQKIDLEKAAAGAGKDDAKKKEAEEAVENRNQPLRDAIAAVTELAGEDITKLGLEELNDYRTRVKNAHQLLYQNSKVYREIMKEVRLNMNVLPPATAMAGIYSLVDQNKEVWKAPANISLSNVVAPVIAITHKEQENLNAPLNGKAINAIRYFTGDGVKVWGARTLDGNSLDWRYINVRRTMIMLEQSIMYATKAFVFEPNVANTWVSVRSMIVNFLTGIWKRGGLAGSTPDDAFGVFIGLGETMTPEDILEGIMRITVLVAISRPAEFIEITFQQQMQKS